MFLTKIYISFGRRKGNYEKAIGLSIVLPIATAKYSANSLKTFAVIDLLLAIFVCWLVVKFLSLRRYEKVTRGTSIRLETLEKLSDERVTGQRGSMGLYGPGGELPRRFACRMLDSGVSIHHWLVFSSRGWCNLSDSPRYRNDLVAIRRGYFPCSRRLQDVTIIMWNRK